MSVAEPLYPGCFYHVFNRGNNGEDLFREPRNYVYFLWLYEKYMTAHAETMAYCLLKNHFHFLIRVRDNARMRAVSQAVSNLCNAYTRALNKSLNRHGSLFEKPFRRKRIETQAHWMQAVYYIHANPVKHGFIRNMAHWKYSSYQAYISDEPAIIDKEKVLAWFGGAEGFIRYHREMTEDRIDGEQKLGRYDFGSLTPARS